MFERLKNVLLIIAFIATLLMGLFHVYLGFLITEYYIGTFWASLALPFLAFPVFGLAASYFSMTILLDWHPINALIIIFFPLISSIVVVGFLTSFELFKPICTRFFNKKEATENDE